MENLGVHGSSLQITDTIGQVELGRGSRRGRGRKTVLNLLLFFRLICFLFLYNLFPCSVFPGITLRLLLPMSSSVSAMNTSEIQQPFEI